MTVPPRSVELADGRTLAVAEAGDPDGHPVFFLHGTPGSRNLYPPHAEDARRQGIRLIGHDRPGYGGSTPKEGRRVGDAAEDVRAIADILGIDRFAVWGYSGGGAPALACAARLPGRAVAVACVAGVAPLDAEGLDWLAGMGEKNVEDFRSMQRDRATWEKTVRDEAIGLRDAVGDDLSGRWATLLSPTDRAALTPPLASYFAMCARGAASFDGAGIRDDGLSEALPWGFDVSAIATPLQLWHGGQDRFVPFSHGQWLAARIPRAEAHLDPDEGHLTLYTRRVPEVHRWLVSHF